jgi:hypothetical protein
MARRNMISAELLQADADNAIAKIRDVKASLTFLKSMSKAERKKERKMGPKSVDYVNDTFAGATTFENLLAKDFSLKEFEKDVVLITRTNSILLEAAALAEALNDTVMLLGADCMAQADEVYEILKSAAKRDGSTKGIVDQISKRFKGQGKTKPTQ